MTAPSISEASAELAARIVRAHVCARCGRYLEPGRSFRSRVTNNRFCLDLKQCDKRARRRSA